MPQAYFTFAEQIFHVEDISLVPQERISLKKALAFTSAFFSPRLSPRLRSLPRRRKQSTGLFSSVAYAPPSLFESLATKIKKHRAQRCCTLYFFGGEQGILSRRCRAYRLAALVATSAKTVRRTVFFRRLRSSLLVRIPCHKIKNHTLRYGFSGGEQGILSRRCRAYRLACARCRVGENSPPDCFLPSLRSSLLVRIPCNQNKKTQSTAMLYSVFLGK